MTHLCVAILVADVTAGLRDLSLAAERGADLIELRVDRLKDPAQVRALVTRSTLPCIVTCRPTWEGGHAELDDEGRLGMLRAAGEAGASYVDIELKTYAKGIVSLPEARPRLIVSAHDFEGRPAGLHEILAALTATGGEVNKLVWTARSILDNLEAFEILAGQEKPTIALCMGEAGLISRVLAKKFGAFLTFASLDGSGGTASGQVPVAEMKELYRWDAIQARTKVYGVVGNPLQGSMSPAIHNATFDAIGHDGVCLPLLVEPGYEPFKAFMDAFLRFEGLDLAGLAITLPHQENCLRYLEERGAEIEPLGRSIRAIDTVVIERAGLAPRLHGRLVRQAARQVEAWTGG